MIPSTRWSSVEYNSNNAWNYNGNNGTLNNNNKYNSLTVRPALDFRCDEDEFAQRYPITLEDWYDVYRKCRQKKAQKPSHLIFYFNLPDEMMSIHHEIGEMAYIPRQSVCFDITYPRLREVIAADFADRLVQTEFTREILPWYENEFFHPDSYSCRVGKGAIRAVQRLQEYIYEATEGYTRDCWIAKIDLRNFFMSIDTDLAVEKVHEFILGHLDASPMRDSLLYISRVVYQSRPQMNCRMNSPMSLHMLLEEGKRMLNKDTPIGVAIGNVTNQLVANFLTTFYLNLLEALDYKFCHYTDDTCIIVTDLERWKRDIRIIDDFLRTELHLTLHPKKRYLQHYSKGVEFLGFKLRYDRILPSDRIISNFKWKVVKAIDLIQNEPRRAYVEKEHFVQVVNSYCGLMHWSNSYRIRKSILELLQNSPWKNLLDFADDYSKVNLKKNKTFQADYQRRNHRRKLWQQNTWNSAYSEVFNQAVCTSPFEELEMQKSKVPVEIEEKHKIKYPKLTFQGGVTKVERHEYIKKVRKTAKASTFYSLENCSFSLEISN